MKTIMSFAFLLFTFFCLTAQSNIQQTLSVNGTGAAAHASAMLDVSANNKGVLVPRMTSLERIAIASPATGLLVFDTTTGTFWFFNGSVWMNIAPQTLLTDADGDTKVQVEESPDEDIIRFDLAGMEKMVLRKNAGGSPRLELPNTLENTFVGLDAGSINSTGDKNSVFGKQALLQNSTGIGNTALGWQTLSSNSTGTANTASGIQALLFNTSGGVNSAYGANALSLNSTGSNNSAFGWTALINNTTGAGNTALGAATLNGNTIGNNNTALGNGADVLSNNLTNATAIGYNAKVGASSSLILGGTGADAVKVGIGYTSPSAPIMIKASSNILPTANGIHLYNDVNTGDEHAMISSRVAGSNGGDPLLSLDVAGEGGWCIGIDNSDENKLKMATNWNNLTVGTALTFRTSGNLGIGTTAPVNKLDVGGGMAIGAGYSGNNTAPSNGAIIQGNVGIGTTSAPQKLTVSGALYGVAHTDSGVTLSTYIQPGSAWIGTRTNHPLYFFTNDGSNRMNVETNGNVTVINNLSKGGGSFKIDHPLDPENKFLYHSFVESPDMMNVYNGNVTTDANGYATIQLPDYFETLNRDFRYQLTVIGTFAQAIVKEKVADNHFVIQTNEPNVEVSWQVTGIRKDPYANQHRIEVEVDKAPDERGLYQHPSAYGLPESRGIGARKRTEDN